MRAKFLFSAVKLEPVTAERFEFLPQQFADRGFFPALLRQQTVSPRHGVQATDQRFGELFLRFRIFAGAVGDAGDDRQHVLDAVIQLRNEHLVLRFRLGQGGDVDQCDHDALDSIVLVAIRIDTNHVKPALVVTRQMMFQGLSGFEHGIDVLF